MAWGLFYLGCEFAHDLNANRTYSFPREDFVRTGDRGWHRNSVVQTVSPLVRSPNSTEPRSDIENSTVQRWFPEEGRVENMGRPQQHPFGIFFSVGVAGDWLIYATRVPNSDGGQDYWAWNLLNGMEHHLASSPGYTASGPPARYAEFFSSFVVIAGYDWRTEQYGEVVVFDAENDEITTWPTMETAVAAIQAPGWYRMSLTQEIPNNSYSATTIRIQEAGANKTRSLEFPGAAGIVTQGSFYRKWVMVEDGPHPIPGGLESTSWMMDLETLDLYPLFKAACEVSDPNFWNVHQASALSNGWVTFTAPADWASDCVNPYNRAEHPLYVWDFEGQLGEPSASWAQDKGAGNGPGA